MYNLRITAVADGAVELDQDFGTLDELFREASRRCAKGTSGPWTKERDGVYAFEEAGKRFVSTTRA